jgi:hypothetical protein
MDPRESVGTCKDAKLSTNESNLFQPLANVTFGFLDVVELPSVGYCGGLLIVSQLGRPLEFHCTAPVVINRAQQILYGQTYRGFLCTEQIGAALIDKAKHVPTAYLISDPDLLPISEVVDPPVVMAGIKKAAGTEFDGVGLKSFAVQEQTYWAVNVHAASQAKVSVEALADCVNRFHKKLPIDEPFERIACAIEEAHAVLRAA